MKTILCFTLTLITIVTIAFVPDSSAQDDSPEYVVGVIYFIPSDRQPDPDIDTKLDTQIKDIQQFYADEMERHGFGEKTFMLEINESDQVMIHHVKGEFNEAYYKDQNFRNIPIELDTRFNSSKNKNIVVIDTSLNFGGFASGGNAYGTTVTENFRYLFSHELGHVFGLGHDWRSESYIMTYGEHPSELSWCAAKWLDAHKYFNPTSKTFNDNTKIQMLTPDFVTSPYAIRLQFEITDPDGLHQAQLIIPSEMSNSLIDCKSLMQEQVTIEFVTTELLAIESGTISLSVIDSQGNIKNSPFHIDITPILPDSEPILIPDIDLANVVRETLNLGANSPITQLDILKLTKLNVQEDLNISDLTGLEHATHLQELTLNHNQIKDMTPLTELTKLKRVILSNNRISNIPSLIGMKKLTALFLDGNQISDITPLRKITQLTDLAIMFNPINTEMLFSVLTQLTRLRSLYLDGMKISDIMPLGALTNLRRLSLSGNQISDITPLTALSSLRYLYISNNQISDITPIKHLSSLLRVFFDDNQISDVKPFAELINIRELGLIGNPIKNREPLLELLRKNPDVKIYLKNYDEPLPVTLSSFRAEHTNTGVVIKWTTESEVDNAGFYIYRSETKDGEFNVVNPTMIQGAGTTAERNEYTWTDTTAKPNTVYYYRIEDVSHAGKREQLATVRLRGLISASGKLTIRWADMKM